MISVINNEVGYGFFSPCKMCGFRISTTPGRSECAKFYSNLKEKKKCFTNLINITQPIREIHAHQAYLISMRFLMDTAL